MIEIAQNLMAATILGPFKSQLNQIPNKNNMQLIAMISYTNEFSFFQLGKLNHRYYLVCESMRKAINYELLKPIMKYFKYY